MADTLKIHNKKLVNSAKALRKNMTPQERKLWYDFLRGYPVRFMRQRVIGDYIVDFYCAKAKLIIEIDGGQHYEVSNIEKDTVRTSFLQQYGCEIIRFSNDEVDINFYEVCNYIDRKVNARLKSH